MSLSSSITQRLMTLRLSRREEESEEGWIVAYADLITLLFIFFSLLLSMSVLSRTKFEMLSGQFNSSQSTSLGEMKKNLDAEISRSSLQAQVSTRLSDEGLLIQFSEVILFPSGQATLDENGRRVLAAFSSLLRGFEKQYHLAVEGHTDSRPINTSLFPSNWSLSSARGVSVLHYLKTQGLAEGKMMVRAYADTRPSRARTENSDSDILAPNRRVTLLIY